MPRRDMLRHCLIGTPPTDTTSRWSPSEEYPLQKGEEIAWQTASAMPQMIATNATRCTARTCIAPLEHGPFYAIKMVIGDLGTYAGIRTDANARA